MNDAIRGEDVRGGHGSDINPASTRPKRWSRCSHDTLAGQRHCYCHQPCGCRRRCGRSSCVQGVQPASKQIEVLVREEDDRQEDRRRSQASLISAWIASEIVDSATGHMSTEIVVRNKSDQPIYECTVIQRKGSAPDPIGEASSWLSVVPPGGDIRLPIEVDLPITITRSLSDIIVQDARGGSWGRGATVRMIFCDAAARCWERSQDGHLREVHGTGPGEH